VVLNKKLEVAEQKNLKYKKDLIWAQNYCQEIKRKAKVLEAKTNAGLVTGSPKTLIPYSKLAPTGFQQSPNRTAALGADANLIKLFFLCN
jgi:hypothetical protein